MVDDSELSETLVPVYRFTWEDGTERTTENLPQKPDGIRVLAEMGKQDENCEVDMIGYKT